MVINFTTHSSVCMGVDITITVINGQSIGYSKGPKMRYMRATRNECMNGMDGNMCSLMPLRSG